jgi:isocitrate dehydrogenase
VPGSAVSPVLREGNSDRRVPAAVKPYARTHPHHMGKWSPASRTHVVRMRGADFYSSEKCMTTDRAWDVRMDLVTKYGEEILLKEKTSLLEGEIIDGMFMSKKALCRFFEEQLQDAGRILARPLRPARRRADQEGGKMLGGGGSR